MKLAKGKAAPAATKEGSGGEALKHESGIWRVVPRLPRVNIRALLFSFLFFLFKKKYNRLKMKFRI